MASSIRHQRRGAINAEQAKRVVSFLVEDTNSRMCAGKNKMCHTAWEETSETFSERLSAELAQEIYWAVQCQHVLCRILSPTPFLGG